jgi:hypothetical protein
LDAPLEVALGAAPEEDQVSAATKPTTANIGKANFIFF